MVRKLTLTEKDELLIRLDERTANIYHLTEKQEAHLMELNDRVGKNSSRLDILEIISEHGMNVRFNKKQMAGGGISLVTFMALVLVAAGKILGWW